MNKNYIFNSKVISGIVKRLYKVYLDSKFLQALQSKDKMQEFAFSLMRGVK